MVTRGFYVHYKGGIYFVTGIAANGDTHNWQDARVIYETVQGCGDDVIWGDNMGVETGVRIDPEPEQLDILRFRTVEDFTRMVDWATGLTDEEAERKGTPNMGQLIPRFQRVVGWKDGRPLVTDPDGRDAGVHVFVPQLKNPGGIYMEGL